MSQQNAPGALKIAFRRLSLLGSEARPRAAATIKRAREWLLEERPSWWPWQWPGLRGIWQRLKLRPRLALPVAFVVVLLLVWFWHWYSFERTDHNGIKHHPHADILNPIGAALGGGILAWAAFRQAGIARRQAHIAAKQAATAVRSLDAQTTANRQQRITESYSKAVDQLASDRIDARLGGIYTLERISKESPDDYWTMMETLTAYVRERSRYREGAFEKRVEQRAYSLWKSAGKPENHELDFWARAVELVSEEPPRTDIAAVLTVIKRRDEKNRNRERDKDWQLDLHETALRGANLRDMHLEYANFQGADLERANLHNARLEGADLERANLHNARLEGADLRKVTGLTSEMLAQAHGNADTKLPDGVERPSDWPKSEAEPDAGAGQHPPELAHRLVRDITLPVTGCPERALNLGTWLS